MNPSSQQPQQPTQQPHYEAWSSYSHPSHSIMTHSYPSMKQNNPSPPNSNPIEGQSGYGPHSHKYPPNDPPIPGAHSTHRLPMPQQTQHLPVSFFVPLSLPSLGLTTKYLPTETIAFGAILDGSFFLRPEQRQATAQRHVVRSKESQCVGCTKKQGCFIYIFIHFFCICLVL